MSLVFPRCRLAPSFLFASACALGLVAPVSAAEDDPLAELRARGLGQSRGMPVPVPPDAPHERSPSDPQTVKMGVIFVNFDGVNLSQGNDSSQNDVSQIFGGAFAAYGGGPQQAAVMEAVRIDWAPYNVLIVDERPASGDYTMNVTSPTNPYGGGVLGVAPLDCNDMQTHNNITFAFHSANDGMPAPLQATTIGQEVAHSYGLEHVDDPSDIMNPFNAGGDPSFKDTCIGIVQGGQCAQQHAANCGSGTSQNSHQELLTLFGTSVPDTEAPSVQITSPMDGDTFEVGAEFLIEATAMDDSALAEIQLFDGDEPLQTDAGEPYSWGVVDIPEGVYNFRVVARDLSDNEAESNTVQIIVGDPPLPNEDTGDGESGDTGDDSDDGSADDDGTGTGPGEMDERGDGKGCGCSQRRSAAGWALAPVLLALRRRRRVSMRAKA